MHDGIHALNKSDNGNMYYIKREDLLPFSFGGNKARKGTLFAHEWKKSKSDCIVTYGSSSSNHCRIIANLAAIDKLPCHIITPTEQRKETFNRKITVSLLDANVHYCELNNVGHTIEKTLVVLKSEGYLPYFVPGGGHGNIGTESYVECYKEITNYERACNVNFDYIFHASGTGTTQAGLVCGKLLNGDERIIVGISIARTKRGGSNVVIESIKDYLDNLDYSVEMGKVEKAVIFTDEYVCGGYGKSNQYITDVICSVFANEGIPLDSTYTGKAFWGMTEYIKTNKIQDKNILFIHTGGHPIFFDELKGV